MYPEAWAAERAAESVDVPRRRRRKPHSVLPAVIVRQIEARLPPRPLAS